MLLSADDRELIQEAIRLAGARQVVLADRIGIAASALSDSLRKMGQRPISDDKLDILFEELIRLLAERAGAASGRQRMRLLDVADELRDARDRLVKATLDSVVPGSVLPGEMASRFRFDADVHLAKALFSTGGVSVRLYPPKMGATSIAAKMEVQAAKDGCRVVRLEAPSEAECQSTLSIMRSFILQITGSTEFSEQVEEAKGLFTTARHALENWVDKASASQPRLGKEPRTLVIMDRLEDWLRLALTLPDRVEAGFLGGFYQVLRYCDRRLIAKRLSILILAMHFPTTLGDKTEAGLTSNFLRQSDQLSIQLLRRHDIENLAVRLNLAIEPSHFARIHEETLGNIFLAHVWLYLLDKRIEPDDISGFVRRALEGRVQDIGVASQAAIAIAIEELGRSVVAGFDLYTNLIRNDISGVAVEAQSEIDNSIQGLRKLLEDKGDPEDLQRYLSLRPIKWLRDNGAVSEDCKVGALRVLLTRLIARVSH